MPASAIVFITVVLARAQKTPRRASLLGIAAGVSFALLAVLTKAVAYQVGRGTGHLFAS